MLKRKGDLKLSLAKKLLNEVTDNYIDFKRSKKPANRFNHDWKKLEGSLIKLRGMKRKGVIKDE